MAIYTRFLVFLWCLSVLTAVSCDGSRNRDHAGSSYSPKDRRKRGMTKKAIQGVLAWRKILLGSQPSKPYIKSGVLNYHKPGDFNKALRDFLSVMPKDISRVEGTGKMYRGRIGDRRVILRQYGPTGNGNPTIDIISDEGKWDTITYTGKT